MKANYHTHYKMCGHAKGEIEDYVKMALKCGFDVFGMSDHLFVPRDFMNSLDYRDLWLDKQMQENQFSLYLKEMDECQKKYPDLIFYKGCETEYLPGHDDFYQKIYDSLDYMNLGIHYFPHNGLIYSPYERTNKDLIISYTDTAVKAMETKLFKIFVHPDLFLYNYFSEEHNQMFYFDKTALECTKRIIEAVIKNDVYLEINCGAIRRNQFSGYKTEYRYPRTEFWKIVKKYPKCKVIIGIDAHDPYDLMHTSYQTALRFAQSLGLNVSSYIPEIKQKS